MQRKKTLAKLICSLIIFSLVLGTINLQPLAEESSGEMTYTVNFGAGSWTIGDVTVTTDKTGEISLSEDDVITLTNFDPETMEIWVRGADDFSTSLTATDGKTTLSTRANAGEGGLADTLTFEIISSNTLTRYVDFGTGSWTIGDVTVTTDMKGEISLSEDDVITLTGFDPETMEVRVSADDGFYETLTVNDNQTSLANRNFEGFPDLTIVFYIVEKKAVNEYYIDFGEGSWTIGDETVTVPEELLDGPKPFLDTDHIGIIGFNPETMDAVVTTTDGFDIYLSVVDEFGTINLVSANVELPPAGDSFTFSVREKVFGNQYYINFGTGKWTIDGTTVEVAELSGNIPFLDTDPIFIEGFNPETMFATLTANDGYTLYLIVEDGFTTLASTENEELLPPAGDSLTFSIVKKYTVDCDGSWTFGDTTVSITGMPEPGSYTITDKDIIPLTNFNPDTMEAWVVGENDFEAMLTVTNNQTSLSNLATSGVVLPNKLSFVIRPVVTNTTSSEDNACNAVLDETGNDLVEKLLTEEEINRLENGEEIKVYMEVEDISSTVSSEDKSIVTSVQKDAAIGMYLDIDLIKKIGNDAPSNITETNGAIKITLELPATLINKDSSISRTYQMIRVHEGIATILPCAYDAATGLVSFETDQFSTYALIYTDKQTTSESAKVEENISNNKEPLKDDPVTTDPVPSTGDYTNITLCFIFLLLSGIAIFCFSKKIFKNGM
ncbi:MAG: hypothetical protein J6J16_04145 [Lachnospiraceae bacterium]|nr:hypothetical protein [Lachnospiraceae bacterium]